MLVLFGCSPQGGSTVVVVVVAVAVAVVTSAEAAAAVAFSSFTISVQWSVELSSSSPSLDVASVIITISWLAIPPAARLSAARAANIYRRRR
jgi:hypothetical protein